MALIAGNFIGVAADGITPLGNADHGVRINDGANNIIGTDGDGQGDTQERNVISANGGDGIVMRYLNDASPVNNTIAGNFIGVAADGTTPLGNAENGVTLIDAHNNTIGGDTAAARNIISGNGGSGIFLDGSNHNVIAANFIGTDVDGTVKRPNVDGIWVTHGASGNLIGGNTDTPAT